MSDLNQCLSCLLGSKHGFSHPRDVNKINSGNLNIHTGESQTNSTSLILGFSSVIITVEAGVIQNTTSGFLLGPFVEI